VGAKNAPQKAGSKGKSGHLKVAAPCMLLFVVAGLQYDTCNAIPLPIVFSFCFFAAVLPELTEKYGSWEFFEDFSRSNILDAGAELEGTKRVPAAQKK
jgi:hypothetical protein